MNKNEEIGARLKQARIAAGFKTARAAAESLGVPYPTYSAHENGTRGVVREAEIYTRRLKISLDWLMHGKGVAVEDHGTTSHEPNAKIGDKIKGAPVEIKVYGQAVGGVDGEFEMNGNVLDTILAPPQISEISDAYAVIVSGDSMSPRYEDGETAFIDPRRRVRKGDYVIAQIRKEEYGAPLAYIKRFERHNQNELVLSQFNPPKELVFPASQVVSVHFIALSGIA